MGDNGKEMKFDKSQEEVLSSRKNFAVVAGAGSGKTRTMVEYVVNHMEESPEERPITSILALTFTEKAATEMRGKIAKSIIERISKAREAKDYKSLSQWERASRFLTQAEIGTLHSYALSLVTRHSHLLGLPVELDVDPDNDQVGVIAETLSDLIQERDPLLMEVLQALPMSSHDYSTDLVKCLTRSIGLVSGWGLKELSPFPHTPIHPSVPTPRMLEILKDLESLDKKEYSVKSYDAWRENSSLIRDILKREKASGYKDLSYAVPKIDSLLDGMNMNVKWHLKPLKNELMELEHKLRDYCHTNMAKGAVIAFCKLANHMISRIRNFRLKAGLLSYDDQLYLARELLKEFPEIREEESKRWGLILIDEFQDTNRLQADILAYLMNPIEDGEQSFQSLDFTGLPNKLKVIGDPKQSIYRFRGAEPQIMNELSERLETQGGERLNLECNYRSRSYLVDFYNDFFGSYLKDQDYFPQKAKAKAPSPGELPKNVVDKVELLFKAPKSNRSPHLDGQRISETLVEYLERVFDKGSHYRVFKSIEGKTVARIPRPGDVAILLRTKKHAEEIQNTLTEKGWPCHTLKGRDPLALFETRALAYSYLFLCGRSPDFNIASVLSSPLGPVSNETLTKLTFPDPKDGKRSTLSHWFQEPFPTLPKKLKSADVEAIEKLRTLFSAIRPYVSRRPPGEIMEAILEERDLLPLLMGMPENGVTRVKDTQYFLSFMKGYSLMEPSSKDSVADILSQLLGGGIERGEQADDSEQGSEAKVEGREDFGEMKEGAINIMTVHASKGLEANMVIVGEADRKDSKRTPWVLISDQGEVALWYPSRDSRGNIFSGGYEYLNEESGAFEAQERKRLLYVAATRARNHLAFIGKSNAKNAEKSESDDTLEKSTKTTKSTKSSKTSKAADAPKGGKTSKALGTGEYLPMDSWMNHLEAFDKIDEHALRKMCVEPQEDDSKPESAESSSNKEEVTEPDRKLMEDFKNFDKKMMDPLPKSGYLYLNITKYAKLLALLSEKKEEEDTQSLLIKMELDEDFDESAPHAGPIGPTGNLAPNERGTLFHAVLEITDCTFDKERYLSEISTLAAELGFEPSPEELDFLATVAMEFQESEIGVKLKEAMENGVVFREWPIWLYLEKDEFGNGPIYLNGVIDLFFIDKDNNGYLIDYKLAKESHELRYEKQLELYQKAILASGFTGQIKKSLWHPKSV
ncbi:MAG: UvrD-helicase domain-containing protein [Deltaproteobacteria bacterium]|jgi:ATP-dependent exoDNAse (exonuclease V) beta subunit|nr:UvrD-helicase domain-containing protein [Deltaproteobacteria bacterium]